MDLTDSILCDYYNFYKYDITEEFVFKEINKKTLFKILDKILLLTKYDDDNNYYIEYKFSGVHITNPITGKEFGNINCLKEIIIKKEKEYFDKQFDGEYDYKKYNSETNDDDGSFKIFDFSINTKIDYIILKKNKPF